MTRYMVIERFRPGCKAAVYQRFAEKGRLLPAGVEYLDSWVEADGERCFQLMQTDDRSLLDEWTGRWRDLVTFEIVEIGPPPAAQPNPQ